MEAFALAIVDCRSNRHCEERRFASHDEAILKFHETYHCIIDFDWIMLYIVSSVFARTLAWLVRSGPEYELCRYFDHIILTKSERNT